MTQKNELAAMVVMIVVIAFVMVVEMVIAMIGAVVVLVVTLVAMAVAVAMVIVIATAMAIAAWLCHVMGQTRTRIFRAGSIAAVYITQSRRVLGMFVANHQRVLA